MTMALGLPSNADTLQQLERAVKAARPPRARANGTTDEYLLLLACELGDARTVQEHLERGVSPAAADLSCTTCLHKAAYEDHVEIIDALVGAGADLDARDLSDSTPLHRAAFAGARRAAAKLIQLGAAIDARDRNAGRTALHWACREGHLGVFKVLIGAKCDPNIPSSDGRTPLHHVCNAAPARAAEFAEQLLAAGADATLCDVRGEDVWALAKRLHRRRVLEVLAAHAQPTRSPPRGAQPPRPMRARVSLGGSAHGARAAATPVAPASAAEAAPTAGGAGGVSVSGTPSSPPPLVTNLSSRRPLAPARAPAYPNRAGVAAAAAAADGKGGGDGGDGGEGGEGEGGGSGGGGDVPPGPASRATTASKSFRLRAGGKLHIPGSPATLANERRRARSVAERVIRSHKAAPPPSAEAAPAAEERPGGADDLLLAEQAGEAAPAAAAAAAGDGANADAPPAPPLSLPLPLPLPLPLHAPSPGAAGADAADAAAVEARTAAAHAEAALAVLEVRVHALRAALDFLEHDETLSAFEHDPSNLAPFRGPAAAAAATSGVEYTAEQHALHVAYGALASELLEAHLRAVRVPWRVFSRAMICVASDEQCHALRWRVLQRVHAVGDFRTFHVMMCARAASLPGGRADGQQARSQRESPLPRAREHDHRPVLVGSAAPRRPPSSAASSVLDSEAAAGGAGAGARAGAGAGAGAPGSAGGASVDESLPAGSRDALEAFELVSLPDDLESVALDDMAAWQRDLEGMDLSPICFGLGDCIDDGAMPTPPRAVTEAWSESASLVSTLGGQIVRASDPATAEIDDDTDLDHDDDDDEEAEAEAERWERERADADADADTDAEADADSDAEGEGQSAAAHGAHSALRQTQPAQQPPSRQRKQRRARQRGSARPPDSLLFDGVLLRLGRVIGHGASSVVREACYPDGRTAAAKMLLGGVSNEQAWLSLAAEAQLAHALEHPNVLRYLGPAERAEERYVLMELAEGGTLRQLLDEVAGGAHAADAVPALGGRAASAADARGRSWGGLPLELARELARQVLSGVVYLHAHQIVHRDIKSGNLLFRTAARTQLMLGDLGSSTSLRSLERSSLHSLHGTPFWMAPEVIAGSSYGRKADVWSVGCVVLEMLTGQPPWATPERPGHEMNAFTVMCRIVTSAAPPPLPDDLDELARDFLLSCFERDASERPSASQLLAHPFLTTARV